MTRILAPRTFAVALAAAASLAFAFTPALAAAPPGVATAAASPGTGGGGSLVKLAMAGRFDDLLHQLQGSAGLDTEPGSASLIRDLKRYHQHQAQERERRDKAFHKVLGQTHQQIDAGHLHAALIDAIEAQNLAQGPQRFLKRPEIAKLVSRADAAAKAAGHSHDWVEAMSDYRLLNLLHEKTAEYRGDLKRAARHVRMLQMYAPKVLDRLVKARDQRLKGQGDTTEPTSADKDHGKAEPGAGEGGDGGEGAKNKGGQKSGSGAGLPPSKVRQSDPNASPQQLGATPKSPAAEGPGAVDSEPWTVKLEGVDPRILSETLAWAARKHVDREHTNYASLLTGSINNLLALLDTDGLSKTFPGLGQDMKARRFRVFLIRRKHDLAAESKTSVLAAQKLVNQIFAMNSITVDLPQKVLVYEMTQGATNTLDTFSDVIWPHELDQFSRATTGDFTGVGIQISRRGGRLVVVTPLQGTPAMKAGIRAGDIIAQVNGKSTENWGLDRAVDAITGPEGTKVTLGIERDGQGVKPYPIRRARIAIKSIRGWQHKPMTHGKGGGWDWFIDPKDRIGYIRLTQFLPQTADDLDAAIAQMQKSGPIHGLILDLRFNPGGLLKSAISVVDRFVTHGDIVSTVDGQHRLTAAPAKARRAGTYPDFPLAVLINQGSASAAEITSGALKDHHRAVIIGTRSFGKGSVQDLFALDNHKALFKLTRQYYELPSGRIVHRVPGAKDWGVHPDIKVRMTDRQVADALAYRQQADVLQPSGGGDDRRGDQSGDKAGAHHTAKGLIAKGLDPQLEAALLVLKTQAFAHDTKLAKAQ